MRVLLLGLGCLGTRTAWAGPRPSDPVEARIAWSIRAARDAAFVGELDRLRGSDAPGWGVDGVEVVVQGTGDPDAVYDGVVRAGFDVRGQAGTALQVFVPWDRLRDLADVPGVERIREPWRARAKDVRTEGYDAVMERDWHVDGITGAGVSVAVVDVGFAGADALAGTEIPANAVADFSRGQSDSTDHGTAVTEIIYDFAPDATYYLASFSTDVELGEILANLTDLGVDVINGSFGFDNVWHADGTSSLSQYADRAVEEGAIYVAAAGNENDKYRVGALALGNGGEVSIAGMTGVWCATGGGYADVSFRWSEPFGQARQDLDLVVYNEDGSVCGRSEETQDGEGWPYELVSVMGCSARVRAVPIAAGAEVTGLVGYLYGTFGIDEDAWTNTEDLTLPGDTFGGVTVGAWYPGDDTLAFYSSRGPTNDGRTKPDVVGPTGVSTQTYGVGRFEGSSAATPHGSGVAALWVSATGRHGRPDRFKEWVKGEARDLGPAGEDDGFGAGALRVDEIPSHCGCSAASGGAPVWAGWALFGTLVRRKRR